ncbi:unnamed protein product [Caenorhabditis auriculariae]|uniref:monoamine oxidase n=1 Tax=Caenorhabditis auriculariae TaxID=2777116 RepID=A0A8S1GMJ3_9PELO|nr:unnamed protein product [Caenorhabditis auriculariae]
MMEERGNSKKTKRGGRRTRNARSSVGGSEQVRRVSVFASYCLFSTNFRLAPEEPMWLLGLTATLLAVVAQPSQPITASVEKETYDVVVVGAGLTGLTAARKIRSSRPEASILILEARPQMGGRIRYSSMKTATGDVWVDTGSQFVSPTHAQLVALIHEVGLDLQPQLSCGRPAVFNQRRRLKREDLSWDNGQQDLAAFLNSPNASELAEVSIQEISSKTNTKKSESINRLLQTFYDAPGEQVAALQVALTAISEKSSVRSLLRHLGHGDSLIVRQGLSELLRRLADGLNLVFNEAVVSVNEAASPVVVETSKREISAHQVIIAVPPAVLPSIRLVPHPELSFQQLIQNYYPTGHAFYFTMTFARAFWRDVGKSGECIFTAKAPIVWMTTFDVSAASSCNDSSSATLWGIVHLAYELTSQQRLQHYVEAVVQALDIPNAVPLDISEVNFSRDVFARGSVATLRPGVNKSMLQHFKGYHTVLQNVHIASAELSNVSMGMMNGAVVAAEAVAAAVSENLRPTRPEMLRDAPIETATNFPYATSSHYPPAFLKKAWNGGHTAEQPTSEKRLPTTQAKIATRDFIYETSSHYPPTEQPPLTTMKHFSYGNLVDSKMENLYYEGPQFDDVKNKEPETTTSSSFVYKTSSVMPSIEPIETTTYKHFSNGNLPKSFGEPKKTETVRKTFFDSTSTHYPPNEQIRDEELEEGTVSSQVVDYLDNIVQQARNDSSLQLATRLTRLLQTLLKGLLKE